MLWPNIDAARAVRKGIFIETDMDSRGIDSEDFRDFVTVPVLNRIDLSRVVLDSGFPVRNDSDGNYCHGQKRR